MAVIVTNIYAKKESPERAPDWCVAIVSRFYPAYFRSNIETGSRLAKANRKRKSKSSTGVCSAQLQPSLPIASTTATSENLRAGNWATEIPEVVIETGNEIVQHANDANGNRSENSRSLEEDRYRYDYNDAAEGSKPEVDDVMTDRKRLRDKQDRHRSELEWKLIAKFTDRVFFWMFLVLSVVVQIVLFMQIVPISPRV